MTERINPCCRCGHEGHLKPVYQLEFGRGYEIRYTNSECNNFVMVIKKTGVKEAAVEEWNTHTESML